MLDLVKNNLTDGFNEDFTFDRSNCVDDYSDIFGEVSNKSINVSNKTFRNIETKKDLSFNLKRVRSKSLTADNSVKDVFEVSLYSDESKVRPNAQKKKCITNEFANKLLEVSMKKNHTVMTSDGPVNFEIKSWKNGTFLNISEIISDQQIYPSYSNNEIIFKCFQPGIIQSDSNQIESYFDNVIAQYNQLIELENLRNELLERRHNEILDDEELQKIDEQLAKLNVPAYAKILNIETAKQDGFFIIEKISEAFEISFDSDTKIEELSDEDKKYLDQVKAGFKFAYDNGICLDYKKDNVGIRDGIVVLFDYMERKMKINLRINTCVQTFAKNSEKVPNQEIYDYLMPAEVPSHFRSKLACDFDGLMRFK